MTSSAEVVLKGGFFGRLLEPIEPTAREWSEGEMPLDVYALIPKGRIRVARVAACLEALRAAVLELA